MEKLSRTAGSYKAPTIEIEEVLIEQGFGISGGHMEGDSSYEEED